MVKIFTVRATHYKITERFKKLGVSGDRLRLEGFSPREQLLSSYHEVDIALDTFPYPGGTTTAESLWMGVPVLSLYGDDFLSRIGASMLNEAGKDDWIAKDQANYIELAIKFAKDLKSLDTTRKQLRMNLKKSSLFNGKTFAKGFQESIKEMWRTLENEVNLKQ